MPDNDPMAATSRPPTGNPSHLTPYGPARDDGTEALPRPGLRERKKIKTRIAIRRAMYRLIAAQGYEATTIEQIADAADVSPSTVFRYFPTKEDIVLSDEYDTVLEARLRARPLDEDPLDSIAHVIRESLSTFIEAERDEVVQRTKLLVEVPAVRARVTESMSTTSQVLVHALADRTGRERDDLQVRVAAAAVLAALREAMVCWAEQDHEGDLPEMADEALGVLRGGLRL
ncbi:TetR/AcrR family transcriptional regulator [Streptomyces sp. NPDC004726]